MLRVWGLSAGLGGATEHVAQALVESVLADQLDEAITREPRFHIVGDISQDQRHVVLAKLGHQATQRLAAREVHVALISSTNRFAFA